MPRLSTTVVFVYIAPADCIHACNATGFGSTRIRAPPAGQKVSCQAMRDRVYEIPSLHLAPSLPGQMCVETVARRGMAQMRKQQTTEANGCKDGHLQDLVSRYPLLLTLFAHGRRITLFGHILCFVHQRSGKSGGVQQHSNQPNKFICTHRSGCHGLRGVNQCEPLLFRTNPRRTNGTTSILSFQNHLCAKRKSPTLICPPSNSGGSAWLFLVPKSLASQAETMLTGLNKRALTTHSVLVDGKLARPSLVPLFIGGVRWLMGWKPFEP